MSKKRQPSANKPNPDENELPKEKNTASESNFPDHKHVKATKTGMEQVLQRTREMMDKHGFAVICTAGEKDGELINIAYTVGLTHFDHAEVFMVGFSHELMYTLLKDVGVKAIAGKQVFMSGGFYDEITKNYPVAMRDVGEQVNPRDFFAMANRLLNGKPYTALQMFVADVNGLFPWDLGCDKEMATWQNKLFNINFLKRNTLH